MKRALIAICMLSLIGGAATWAVAGDAKAPDKPIELKSSEHKKMWVKFNHATHESVECDVCHHPLMPRMPMCPVAQARNATP